MGALTNYCQTDYPSKWIVSRSDKALVLAQRILAENALDKDESIQLKSLCELSEETLPDLIIVFELALQEALATSKSLNAYKDKSIPVVFGNARDVFFQKPAALEQGISYAGMFQLCSAYLMGQKALKNTRLGYAEFGVFDGRTFSLAWQMLNKELDTFFAFDSFKGILDKAPGEEVYYQTGDYYSNLSTFKLNMSLCGVEHERVRECECDFDSNLENQQNHNVVDIPLAVVHVDCDVYPAALHVLNFVTPHLADGCILLFDDYDSMWGSPDMGEVRALKEWQQAHPEWSVTEYRRYSATGRAFLCYRK